MPTPKSDLPQGTLDLLILTAVAVDPVHGYAIAQRLEQVSRGTVRVPEGSLYPALHRLENRGLLAADWKKTETGREAKFYRLTRKGRKQTRRGRSQLEAADGCGRPYPRDGPGRRAMNWWSRFWRGGQMEGQLERELRFHLDQHASDLMARGCTPDQARREARLALGGPEQVKEECRDARGTRWLEDIVQDTCYALRAFRQKPGFAIVAAITLSLGIGATTVMFAVVNSVLLRPLSYRAPEKLVAVHAFTAQFGEFWGVSNPDLEDIDATSRSLTIAAWTWSGGTISEPGEPEYVDGRLISAALMNTLGMAPLHGRAFQPTKTGRGAPVAIISYGLWQRRFAGDPSAVGRTIVYEGKPWTVIGVAPGGFSCPAPRTCTRRSAKARTPNAESWSAFHSPHRPTGPGVHSWLRLGRNSRLIARHLAEHYPKSTKASLCAQARCSRRWLGDVGGTLWLAFVRGWD